MSEVPTPVSEATNVEIKRIEGATFSEKAVDTLTAGDLVYHSTNSGLIQAIEAINGGSIVGACLYDAVSGERVIAIKGHVRCRWDGTGTVSKGTLIVSSDVRSGWFEPLGAVTSGTLIVGRSVNALVAANSGTLVPVMLFA